MCQNIRCAVFFMFTGFTGKESFWNWTMQVDAIFALNGALALGSPCAVANSNTMFFCY